MPGRKKIFGGYPVIPIFLLMTVLIIPAIFADLIAPMIRTKPI